MHKMNLPLIILIAVVTSCVTKSQEKKAKVVRTGYENETKIKEIVLVNAGEIDRCQMGQLINTITQCNPKAIGLNLLLVEEKDRVCDSILQQSIITSDKVILVEDYDENGNPVESNKKFYDYAFLSGLTGLTQSKSGTVDYYHRMVRDRGKWSLTFPFLMALQYNKNRGAELSSKVTPQKYPIIFYHNKEDFQIIEQGDLESKCNLFADKIVLVGYLGPNEENIFLSNGENSPGKAYGTVITVNIILDILKDLQ